MEKEKTISSNSLMQEFKYEDGSILKVNVVNNKKEGPYKYYFKSGDIEEGTYENGVLEGPYTIYFKDGDREEGTYKNDMKMGKQYFIK